MQVPAAAVALNQLGLGGLGSGIYQGIMEAPSGSAETYMSCAAMNMADCSALIAAGKVNTPLPTTNTAICALIALDSCSYSNLAGLTYKATFIPPPAPPESDPCFPSSAMVTKADGRAVRLDALKDGDEIVSATADGVITTDSVSMLLSVAQPEADATFITLTTNGGSVLNLTAEHHLPVGAACCSTLKKAAEVAVGDAVWVVSGAAAVAQEVTKLTKTASKGLHSPVLKHGSFPVVNGIVTSFDSIGKVMLASYGLPLALTACEATNTCDTLRYALVGK
jgi:hypothetical protein